MRRYVTALFLVLSSFDLAAAVTGFVIDENGKPIAGARVRALAPESSDVASARVLSTKPEPEPIVTVQTGDDGAYRLDVKRQPVVSLVIDKDGYTPSLLEAADGIDAGVTQLRATTSKKGKVTAAGKPVAGAWVIINNAYYTRTDDKGEYTMPDPKQFASSVLITHPDFAPWQRIRLGRDVAFNPDVALDRGTAITGRVVDPQGRPVANAVVRDQRGPVAASGEDGSFTVAHLASDVKLLRATAGTRVGSARPADVTTIVVKPGGTVLGTVRSSKDDLPIPGAKVALRGDVTAPPKYVVSDAKGAYVIEGVEPGPNSLIVNHPLYVSTGQEVTVTEGRTDKVVTATPMARISGSVADEEKKAVSGARVGATPTGVHTFSAPDGSFSLRLPVFERAVTFDVSKPSFATVLHGPMQIEAGDVKSGVRIVLARGTKFEIALVDEDAVAIPNEPVNISRRVDGDRGRRPVTLQCGGEGCRSDANGKVTLNLIDGTYDVRAGGDTTVRKELLNQTLNASASPMTIELERGATIEGRVVWSDGSPMTGQATVIVPRAQDPGVPVIDGAFTIRNVAAGKVALSVRTPPPSFLETDPVEVTAPATGVVLKVPRPGRIEGKVVDRDGGRAVRQFSVSTESRSGRRFGGPPKSFTSDDGRFVLEEVWPGTQDVVVTAPGYVRATSSAVEVVEGKTANVEVTLDRGATIVGRVSASGRPVSGANINVEGNNMRAPSKQTDANGDFVLDTVPAGDVALRVSKQGFVDKRVSVTAVVGKETRADVELSSGREILGRVTDSMGQPVAGASVSQRASRNPAQRPFGFGFSPITTDAEGNFRLEGVPDEAVTVSASKEGYAEASAEVAPGASSVLLTLGRGGTISGRVTGLPREELAGVEVTATGRGLRAQVRTSTDAGGAFTIAGVPDGEVTLHANQSSQSRRSVSSAPITVAGGSAPFVEIDFAAGLVVRGRVTRAGQPVIGMLNFSPADPRVRGFTGGDIGADGLYEMRVPAAGEYRIHVTPREGGTIDTGTVVVNGDTNHDIEIRGGMLRGRVVEATTGAPMPNVRVELISPGRGSDRTSDSAGRFAFEFVPEGTHTVRASSQGYIADSREVVVQGSAAPEVELLMSKGELVEVKVIDAVNKRDLNAYTSMSPAEAPKTGMPAQQRAPGVWRFWLRPGQYTLRAWADGYKPASLPVTVPAPAPIVIELEVKSE